MGTHYSFAQDKTLLSWAEKTFKKLMAHCKKNKIKPVLAYSGMSGISSATAIYLVALQNKQSIGMMYIRKDDELCHGRDIETNKVYTNGNQSQVFFVDDFISSGATLKHTLRKIHESGYYKRLLFGGALLQTNHEDFDDLEIKVGSLKKVLKHLG